MASSGIGGVTIEALCERLGLSKGSFYHHFKGMAGFRTALLEHFEERETRAFVAAVEALPLTGGAERLWALAEAVAADEAHDTLEPQVRVWASRDPVAREHLERVDRRRLEYLREQCRLVTQDADLADDVATTIYLVVVGASHVVPQVLVRDQVRLWDRLAGRSRHDLARRAPPPGGTPPRRRPARAATTAAAPPRGCAR
ncbi:TetR/AcrR family transcriptional regulator [Isoptericola variabilis]|uniref:TetR/AcrR family transcriptional regulator n=1 Tax=Isoptericola variabilis TaxID=139208 RepID=UPI0021BD5275|nr:TetR/AcrR family transcriptional regulator [Isoptericola variabilis]